VRAHSKTAFEAPEFVGTLADRFDHWAPGWFIVHPAWAPFLVPANRVLMRPIGVTARVIYPLRQSAPAGFVAPSRG
jgi:hypothetical protein